jgi:YidC/Oxa1 family membrane protein insertase
VSILAPWHALKDGLEQLLRIFADFSGGVFGEAVAWGWAIILLTIAVRFLLVPLAVKQTNSMRAMQQLQPEMKRIKEKYKADRSMMKTDPEKYQQLRKKQQEETMALYKEHNVNPAASCLPLLLQLPIFIALIQILRGDRIAELAESGFYFVTNLAVRPTEAGLGAILLVLLTGITTYVSQKQMMAKNDSPSGQQQKIMLYAMPLFLTVVGFQLPVGPLLYILTQNVWQGLQQWVMFRNVGETATT